jgi:hypothetical protein
MKLSHWHSTSWLFWFLSIPPMIVGVAFNDVWTLTVGMLVNAASFVCLMKQ